MYAQNAPTPTGTPSASSVIQQDIFVRGGPGRDYLPVGKLLAGDRIRPLSRNAQGDWVLIIYGKSFGWIRRDLAFWVENIDVLPVIDVANLTPSPMLPTTPTNTPLLLPTSTPLGNWVNLDGDAQSGFVRAGPGRTYLRLGQLLTGDGVVPVSRNTDGSWIMIRYGEGFGWVSRSLVLWVDNIDVLPVVLLDNLTPSATYTATLTPSATSTFTPTSTFTATFTPTSSATPTQTPSQTATFTSTATLTQTSTPLPTVIPTLVPSATYTNVPTHTSTVIPSATVTFTSAPSATHTLTLTATNTATIVVTSTIIPTETPTVLAVVIVPSATITATSTSVPPTITPTTSLTSTLTATSVPPTATHTPTMTVTLTNTLVANIVSTVTTPSLAFTSTIPVSTKEIIPSPTTALAPIQTATSVVRATLEPSTVTNGQSTSNSGIAPEVIIAAVVLIAILVYAVLYWRGTSGSERYADGFVIEICPVCQRGHLLVESRQERLMGIPRSRHSVRCTECRSVLREVSGQQWRYAVDPIENPDLYERFNGSIVDNQTLADLEHNLPQIVSRENLNSPATLPDFIDDDT